MSRVRFMRISLAGLLGMVGIVGVSAAEPSLPDEVTLNGVELVRIPAGWYHHRSDVKQIPESDQKVFARIWLDDYYLAKYEARASDFARFLESPAGSAFADSYLDSGKACGLERRDGRVVATAPNLPVAAMTALEADAFAAWMGLRLPSGFEWEKAARGHDLRRWPWGGERPDDTRASYWRASLDCYVTPVDRFRKGVSPFGIYGMAGGVAEFVSEWATEEWEAVRFDGQRNPEPSSAWKRHWRTGQRYRLLRGGCWDSGFAGIGISGSSRTWEDARSRCNGARFAIDAGAVAEYLSTGAMPTAR